ncbi:O-acetylhomoserine aminocarboxypropyltransferase/cysteine synthase [Lentisphaera profundi]|uniref:O-acetylhomoserine aminocarboxypropyltransferase/cysteine synthase n=1 Tax=Lentisphaera profundi TaxID=1658616 RepID=A0ABY7VWK4_9BACT|nr:O-acetylhomoserine aminocarboxypropyltransferase/cysteine synthase family protein [Lentisphaera profundi]WDE98164.1 O-acetylhomoserine aminocarboxypropyltransferase/cysteine synthase [Lentisphaera profundi]
MDDQSKALHSSFKFDPSTNSVAVPIYQTSSYAFNSSEHAANLFSLSEFGNIYTRLMNPTTDVFEKRMTDIEGGTGALSCSSGMSAIFLAVTTLASAGDHIICSASLYGGTETLFRYTLKKFGIEVTFLKDFTADNINQAIKFNTKLVFAEAIGNPQGDVIDFEAISECVHDQGLAFILDNTFAPIFFKPFKHGVDIVVYSCTKWIGGHGTSIGGLIIDSGQFNWGQGRYNDFTEADESYHGLVYWDALGNVPGMGNVAYIIKARVEGMRNMGMCPSPFNSFQLIQGLETLPLRIDKHAENALKLAKYLEGHEKISWVNFTGLKKHSSHEMARKYFSPDHFGSVFGFGVKGGIESAKIFIDSVEMAYHLANVGDARTLVIHPASTTHQQMTEENLLEIGIKPDFVRVSVGIEAIEDIITDFDQALAKV